MSYIGDTEEFLCANHRDYWVGRGLYKLNPRGQILGETGGILKLLFEGDEMRLVGIHGVGYNMSELIHLGQAYLHSEQTAFDIAEMLFNYPTLSDLYRHAAIMAIQARENKKTSFHS